MITPTGIPGDRTHAKNPLLSCCSESRTCRRAVALHALLIQGDLENYLLSHPHIYLSDRVDLCFDTLVGLKELHSGFIIHRDLKLKNIFVDGQDRGVVGDLGVPRVTQQASSVGTIGYQASEVYSN
jgi:serine/threonine protein kinase